MADLIAFVPGIHEGVLRALLTAYLMEPADDLQRVFGFTEDIPSVVDEDMQHLDQFAPPFGRLLLVVDRDAVLGCGAMRQSLPGIAEVKRMYLTPEARGRGVGRTLLGELVAAAVAEGYREIRLDTDGLMPAAIALYESAGFIRCEPYPESDIPVEFHDRWLFMRRDLAKRPIPS